MAVFSQIPAAKGERQHGAGSFAAFMPLPDSANLMAHPMAGAMALSALGMGMASHAFGLWMGSIASSLEAAGNLPALDLFGAGSAASRQAPAAEERRAPRRSATVTPLRRAPAPAPLQAEAPAEALMPEDFRRPPEVEKPAAPDDLKRISGIGPKLEQVLNGLGIWTFAQIAAWQREEVAWMDDYLAFHGRIVRDGWLEQAAKLASGD
jgi:NADH-quinone oxidoreductase subunit E